MFELFAVLLMVLLSVGGGLLLYAMIDAETDQRQAMDRESAERVARRDTDDGTGRNADPSAHRDNDLDAPWNAEKGNHWSGDRDDR